MTANKKNFMETASTEIRAKKKPAMGFDMERHRFHNKFEAYGDPEFLRESVFQSHLQTDYLESISKSINVIKWILLIAFIATVLMGIYIGVNQ